MKLERTEIRPMGVWRLVMAFTRRRVGLLMLVSIVLQASGCATSLDPVEMAPRSVTKRLGLPECRATIPLNTADAAELARKWDFFPDPGKDPQWAEMAALSRPGDELRLVSCRVGTPYFYALIRNRTVIFKYPLPVLD